MKHYFFVFFIFCVPILNINAQESLDEKYLVALIYLKSDIDINSEIKKTFQNWQTSLQKEKYVNFNISKRIEFLSLLWFEKELKTGLYNVDSTHYTNLDIYYEKNYFSFFCNDRISKLVSSQEKKNKLYLTFSKPVDNFLLAEICVNYYPEYSDKHGSGKKMGNAIQFLFIFNENGLIENVLHKSFHY